MNVYYDADASTTNLSDRPIAVIGYGSQGRAQALNLRDSGFDVTIGNIKDQYWGLAIEDQFNPVSIFERLKISDIDVWE